MAHELTHVVNRDVMVMTLASFFATIAAYIVQFGFLFGGASQASTTTAPEPRWCCCWSRSVVYAVSFPAHAGAARATASSRRRPRRGADHRPPERPGQRADEDLVGGMVADPAEATCAQRA